jgi:Co/Zn/Cd efflux system component
MARENPASATRTERATLRTALGLNAAMFVIGLAAGYWADSAGMMADALDMATDAVGYALALMAIARDGGFKRNAARWTGGVLIVLGGGVAFESVRRAIVGSEPMGWAMMTYSAASFAVNVYVLARLAKYRSGEVHLRASYICTRADVIASIAVFTSGAIVAATHLTLVDLVVGFAIGIYVLREALEILREANEQPEAVR